MNGINYNHYNTDYNDTGEIPPETQSLESTALSMIAIIIFISLYSSLCGICHQNNENNENDSLRNDSLRNSLLTKIEGKKSFYEKNNENDICSICLENFIKKDKIITLGCDHYYHVECITNWLKKDETCPLCREILL